MITRIPQPQFVGAAPSDVVNQAAQLGQRQAQLFAQGIQQGAQNYYTQQQEEARIKSAEKIATQQTQSESDKLRMSILAQDLQNDLQTNGAMTYVDRKSEWLQYFNFMANGDKDLAKSMYEGGASALNQMSATDILRAGLIGPASAPTGQPGQAPQAPPALPQGFTGVPGPTPQKATTTPMMAPGYVNPQGSPTAMAPQVQAQAPAPSVSTQGQTQSVSITDVTKGLPTNAVTTTANQGLSKIAGIAMGNVDPSTSVTPKEQAAINNVLKPTLQVLKNSKVAAWLAAGGKQETLDQAVQQLNSALDDPQFAQWLNTANVMSDKDAASYDSYTKNDTALQNALEKVRHDVQLESKSNMTVAAQAYSNMLKFQQAEERLQITAANTKDNTVKTELEKFTLVEKAVNDYDVSSDKLRDQYLTSHKGASEDDIQNYLNQVLSDPSSGLSSSLNTAAKLYGALMNEPVDQIALQLKAQYFLGIPFFQTSPGSTFKVPAIPSPPTGQSGVSTVPNPQKTSDQALIDAVMGAK